MATSKPRISAPVEIATTRPVASKTGPPANPSCIGAVVRMTCSIDRRRPVRSGPPMTAMMPALAVMALLHERATAMAICPTRGVTSDCRAGVRPRPGARNTASPVAGSQPASSASTGRPSSALTFK